MLDSYIDNFEVISTSILLTIFITILSMIAAILIISLILLAIGCLIRSQKLKSRFLVFVPCLLIGIIILLLLPITFIQFKNLT